MESEPLTASLHGLKIFLLPERRGKKEIKKRSSEQGKKKRVSNRKATGEKRKKKQGVLALKSSQLPIHKGSNAFHCLA